MKQLTRIALLILAMGVGFAATMFMVVGLSAATDTGQVDLALEMEAPARVEISSTFVVRIAYFNYGTDIPTDAWVTAVLPGETQFITATDRWGAPLPPHATDGYTLTWGFAAPHCHMPLDACCGHVLITLRLEDGLSHGTILTTTASITSTDMDSDLTNNQTSIASIAGDMGGSTKQVHARHVTPGGVLSYTITISISWPCLDFRLGFRYRTPLFIHLNTFRSIGTLIQMVPNTVTVAICIFNQKHLFDKILRR